MYDIYLDSLLLPVTPGELKLKIKNKNETVSLLSGGEINILKAAGLTEIEFEALFPAADWVHINGSFKPIEDILTAIEKLKTEKKSFQFIVARRKPNGAKLYNTNLKVALEDYSIAESHKNINDITVKFKLKQAPDYSTKIVSIAKDGKTAVNKKRETSNSPKGTSYKVVSGDSLWKIAKKMYGDGALWGKIYNANKSVVGSNPNLIYPNQVLSIPREG